MLKQEDATTFSDKLLSKKIPPADDASMIRLLDLFSGKWTLRVLYEMATHQCLRFGELKREIPKITSTMLATTLRDLEKNGFLTRVQYNEIPPKVEYQITPRTLALIPVFFDLVQWEKDYNDV